MDAAKSCKCCDALLVRRANETRKDFRRRHYCNKSCAAKKGIAKGRSIPLEGRTCSGCQQPLVRRISEAVWVFNDRKTCLDETCKFTASRTAIRKYNVAAISKSCTYCKTPHTRTRSKYCSRECKSKHEYETQQADPAFVQRELERKSDKEYRKTRRDRANARYADPNDSMHHLRLEKHYGITLAKYQERLRLQDYRCAICGTSSPQYTYRYSKFVLDHDHVTGRVRGILCRLHNTGIGALGDNYEGVLSALNYLAPHAAEAVIDEHY